MKVAELDGAQLDYWVARAEDREVEIIDQGENPCSPRFYARLKRTGAVWWPSSKASQGNELIDRYRMYIQGAGSQWLAHVQNGPVARGATLLQAACRAVVASKFGDTVDDSETKPLDCWQAQQ